MPFDRKRKASTEFPGETCTGIAQCATPFRDYRPGKCDLDGCPRRRIDRGKPMGELVKKYFQPRRGIGTTSPTS